MTAPTFNITDLINSLKATLGTSTPGGLSDELAAEYIRASGQQGSQAVQSAVQLALQQQQNQLRFQELMGSSGAIDPRTGTPDMTDAARRWRDELTAQQGVQNQRLAQELSGLTGYVDPTYRGGSGNFGGYGYNDANSFQAALEMARQAGTYTGGQTLAERQRLDATAQAEAERQLRERLQSGQQAWQGQESAYERQLRERLQAGQLSQQESEFARNYLNQRAALTGYADPTYSGGSGQIGGYGYNDANSFQTALNMAKQAGTYQPALTEAARAARAAEEARQAEISGQLAGGGYTEESRAAREQERNQRASLAAQLLSAPKDVFKAGAFFRSLGGDAGNMMGLGGGGIAGFNSMAGRMATPGTVSLEDVERQAGGAMQQPAYQNWSLDGAGLTGSGATAAAPVTQTQQEQASGQEDPQAAAMAKLLGSGTSTTDMDAGPAAPATAAPTGDLSATALNMDPNAAAAKAAATPPAEDEQVNDGSQPGGPVGSMVAAGLGDLGLGGGGNFTGRAQPDSVVNRLITPATDPIPYVDPRVLEEPEVQQMFRDLRQQGVRDSAANRAASRGARPSGPGGPTGRTGKPAKPGPHRFGQKTAEGRRNSSERMLLGLNRILQKASLPGTQPGGPVDAPLWPTDGGGSAMPTVQDPGSLGQQSSFNNVDDPDRNALPGIASVDQKNQDAALNEMKYRLMQGPGSMGPQTLERMSGTQRGVMEGALEALGLRPEDFNEAYAQTRFANVGNVLSA
jgi:hypothetical protein